MILPFDIILASDQARMGMFFVRMGLVPELASSYYVVQRVGFAKASEMCLTGKLYPATELVGTGLVNDVVPHDQLLTRAFEMAAQIAANSAPALRMIKALLTSNGACEDLACGAEARDRGAHRGLRDARAQGSGQGVPREEEARLPRRGGHAGN